MLWGRHVNIMLRNFLSFFKTRSLWINLAIALASLVLIFWLIFAWMRSYTRHGDMLPVPKFLDLKTNNLDAFVEGKDVSYEIIDSFWDAKKPKGVVIRQDPEEGTEVKKGRKIYLYVTALVPPKIAMPKLEDLSLRQAIAVCESYGLEYASQMTNDVCNGCVVEQRMNGKRVEPGTMIPKGSKITILIGKGAGESGDGMAVPDLHGLTFRAARGKLVDLGLEWVLVTDKGVSDTLAALIYNQSPESGPGKRLVRGATIDLFLTNDRAKLSAQKDSIDSKDPD
jgi:eukaryotic-like serine/threonine-protein kinase